MGEPGGHVSVLYDEVLAWLRPHSGGWYVDATLGGAGHAKGILIASHPDGRLVGLDADPGALSFASKVLESFGDRVLLRSANFRQLGEVVLALGIKEVDGILMDLGLSSRQLDDAERGFSFSQDGPLDMRMDRDRGQSAADLVNHLSEADLANLLWRYGEERKSRRIARAITAARPLATTGQLADLVARTVGRREKIHPATRTFQALRMAVNDELAALGEALEAAYSHLRLGGRMVIITFHSLEDRVVKRSFKRWSQIGEGQHKLRIITRKPVLPSAEEIEFNPRSRSAKMRVAVKV